MARWTHVLDKYSHLSWTAQPVGNPLVRARAGLPLQLLRRSSMSAITKAAPRPPQLTRLCSTRRSASGGWFSAQGVYLTAQQ